MKRSFVWLFVILIPIILIVSTEMGYTATGCASPPAESDIPQTINVTGAGTTEVNGTYTRGTDIGIMPSWSNGTYTILWCDICGRWEIQDGGCPGMYFDGNGSLPSKTGWTAALGADPPPTLSW
ncbi:MAG: hypothetical protein JSV25_02245 [Spirochaetota bacterium]|nr:MAG: hypothetical protein JSV25_02245 [Spirochaetota bacterium]